MTCRHCGWFITSIRDGCWVTGEWWHSSTGRKDCADGAHEAQPD